ncbi:hypothetical protein NM208_g17125 [Fusarium decemcellulare]|uniref:Uncharacterized protein n=1 Tax=Fusarium decemcellulare TaxID=57161 RepID=A0ACC1R895_9HYPO|nr:hypothetical protein NM208_g17125 [Fusarium decemcellulare]
MRRPGEDDELYEPAGMLGESTWETSPAKGVSRENSAANTDEAEAGVLGLIYQLQQTQRPRRGGGMTGISGVEAHAGNVTRVVYPVPWR